MKTAILKSTSDKWLAGILICSVVFRIAAALYFGDVVTDLPGTFDQISYHNLALRVMTGHGFSFGETWWPITPANAPTAHWSFLYTLYLAATYIFFGPHPIIARIIQAIITGLLHPYLAYRIGEALFSRKTGLISAGLTAIYAYFIYYDATLMTEPFFITLVMASLYFSIRIGQEQPALNEKIVFNRRMLFLSLIFGFTLGGAVLLRQLILLVIPFLYLWICWIFRKRNIRVAVTVIGISSVIVLISILPFSVYNLNRFGHFVLLNTNSGYAFFWANHPIYGTQFQPILTQGSYQDLIPVELRHLDEAQLDQALMRRGMQFVLEDPIRYILLSFSRIPSYFMFWPSSGSGLISNISRVASFGIFWPFMLFGLIKSWKDKKVSFKDRISSSSFLLIFFVVLYAGIHILSWALIRYRLPVDAVMLIFASYAFIELWNYVSEKRRINIKPNGSF